MIIRLEYNTDTRKLIIANGVISSDTAVEILNGFARAAGSFAGELGGLLDAGSPARFYEPGFQEAFEFESGMEERYEEIQEAAERAKERQRKQEHKACKESRGGERR